MGLLDGGLARIFGAAFGQVYLPATLHRRFEPVIDAGGSVISPGGYSDAPCRAQPDLAEEAMDPAQEVIDVGRRILVLKTSLAYVPTTDDQITVRGQRWAISTIGQDPAGSYWDLRVKRAP